MSEIRNRYETGRSDGYAEGAVDAQWYAGEVSDKLAHIGAEVRHARDYVDLAAAGYPTVADPRMYRAYYVGFARGYRESVGIGGRT